MKALVLGHSFVRRLRDWMRDNDREMSRGSLDVHLQGVGGRTVRQLYDLDMKRVERIHPDVILLQLGGNDISSCTSASDFLVRLEQLITVLRQKCPDSTIIVASIFCRRRPRGLSSRSYDRKKKRVNKFLLRKFGAFEQGKKVFFFSHRFFKEKYFHRDGFTSIILETGVSFIAFCQLSGWPCKPCRPPFHASAQIPWLQISVVASSVSNGLFQGQKFIRKDTFFYNKAWFVDKSLDLHKNWTKRDGMNWVTHPTPPLSISTSLQFEFFKLLCKFYVSIF